jgi:ATP-dependent exoDNAse (exonuclease V) beta subunit
LSKFHDKANAIDGCIPSDLSTGSTVEIEEERRLLYVAMTRAKDHLLQQHACNTATRKTNRMQHCKAKKRMASAAELSPTSARAARIRGAQLSREPRYSSKELLEPLTERDELGVCCCRHARFAL